MHIDPVTAIMAVISIIGLLIGIGVKLGKVDAKIDSLLALPARVDEIEKEQLHQGHRIGSLEATRRNALSQRHQQS
jgi:hypothetical protein